MSACNRRDGKEQPQSNPTSEPTLLPADSITWEPGWSWQSQYVNYRTDRDTVYSGQYSIVVDNTRFNDAWAAVKFPVSPNSMYRISAMVKMENFRANPDDSIGGASIGIAGTSYQSLRHTTDQWTRLEFEFPSREMSEMAIALRNGGNSATNSGTAYFSDIRIERAETVSSTEWNVLNMIFLNFDAPGFEPESLNEADVQHIKETVSMIKDTMASISGGLMKINLIDFAVIDEPIRVLNPGTNSTNHEAISRILDERLKGKDYSHIILVTPLGNVAKGWMGLGGMAYRSIGISEIHRVSGERFGFPSTPPFPDAVFVHEILHDLERISKEINPNTADLHGNDTFGYRDAQDEWRAWYTAYMRNTLPGGRGLDRRAFAVYRRRGKFQTVFSGM
jgi:hypothetical protein